MPCRLFVDMHLVDKWKIGDEVVDADMAKASVDRIFGESVESLSRRGTAAFPVSWREWSLPEEGKVALSSYGLPSGRGDDLMGIVAEFQESPRPLRVSSGGEFYILGSYGSASIVAVKGVGEVVAFPEGWAASSRVKPSSGFEISPTFVNSKVELFVECAWRWDGLVAALAEEEERAGEAEISMWREGGVDESCDPYSIYSEMRDYACLKFMDLDPGVKEGGFWVSLITDG
ncbi:hypothetical protein GCM10027160_44090 [Streptomyces calidiresistens]